MDSGLRRNDMVGLAGVVGEADSCPQMLSEQPLAEKCALLPDYFGSYVHEGGAMKYSGMLFVVFSTVLAACASGSVTQLSRNTAVITTAAAPICRTTGAAEVANQMAAIATIKAGYQRFIVGGFGTANNTRVVATGPTFATTTGTFNRMGNTVYGTANTSYGGQSTYVTGSNNAEMQITMLNPGDAGYEQGIDARAALGPDWQKKVDGGINNCF
jgi:hypothetical protein